MEHLILLETLMHAPLRFITVCFPPDCRLPCRQPAAHTLPLLGILTILCGYCCACWGFTALAMVFAYVQLLPCGRRRLKYWYFQSRSPSSPADCKADNAPGVFALCQALQFAVSRLNVVYWHFGSWHKTYTDYRLTKLLIFLFLCKQLQVSIQSLKKHNLATQCNTAANIFCPVFLRAFFRNNKAQHGFLGQREPGS